MRGVSHGNAGRRHGVRARAMLPRSMEALSLSVRRGFVYADRHEYAWMRADRCRYRPLRAPVAADALIAARVPTA